MGKIVIDGKMLGTNLIGVLNKTINTLIFELELDGEQINKELESSKDRITYIRTLQKYFGEHLILRNI